MLCEESVELALGLELFEVRAASDDLAIDEDLFYGEDREVSTSPNEPEDGAGLA